MTDLTPIDPPHFGGDADGWAPMRLRADLREALALLSTVDSEITDDGIHHEWTERRDALLKRYAKEIQA